MRFVYLNNATYKQSMGNEQRRLLQRNIKLLFGYNFLTWFMILIPVIVPFFESKGLDMAQIYILQALFSGVVLVFEVPSGYIADIWGRRNTLILAAIVSGLGGLALPFAEGFWGLLVFEILLGIGISLKSGADTALLYDTMSQLEGADSSQSERLGKLMFTNNISETIASILGGFIAMYSYEVLAWLCALIYFAPGLIAYFMVEPDREKMDIKETSENFKKITKRLLKESPLIRLTFINLMSWSACTLVLVWSYQSIWMERGVSITYLGLLWAVMNLFVGLTSRKAHYYEGKFGTVKVLWFMVIIGFIGFTGFALAPGYWVLPFALCFSILRGLNSVILRDALNSRMDPSYRATANSLASLGMRSVFIVAGPIFGWSLETYGSPASFAGIGLVYLGFTLIAFIPLIKVIKTLQEETNNGVLTP